ncbi:MAG: endolytic transglycosylase MltG, partial [Armatimonadota bacterium]|nr:endolytic transglycosylase MltG [Armatimonadota bacterium]
DSPYNTYLHAGLPPGPIASPGLAAIEAALRPARTDYLFYVARPDGSHAFSRTLAEHLVAVRRYRP